MPPMYNLKNNIDGGMSSIFQIRHLNYWHDECSLFPTSHEGTECLNVAGA